MRAFLYLACCVFLLGSPARALETGGPLTLRYGIYTSGFHVLDLEGVYAIGDDSYTLAMEARTRGLLGKPAPWSGVLHSKGLIRSDPAPLSHSFASTWRGKTTTTLFTYEPAGLFRDELYTDEDGLEEIKNPDKSLTDGTSDLLTALLQVMRTLETSRVCTASIPVFDGKRRFDMVFRDKGLETIKPGRYSLFSGEARSCEAEIVPVAGKWRDKPRGWMSIQQQAKGKGMLPRIWFARLEDSGPYVPVRVEIRTHYGTMILHLTSRA